MILSDTFSDKKCFNLNVDENVDSSSKPAVQDVPASDSG